MRIWGWRLGCPLPSRAAVEAAARVAAPDPVGPLGALLGDSLRDSERLLARDSSPRKALSVRGAPDCRAAPQAPSLRDCDRGPSTTDPHPRNCHDGCQPGLGPYRRLRRGDMGSPAGDLLRPYVPRLLEHWLAREPGSSHRAIVGTAVFADISGFTRLTERLARHGNVRCRGDERRVRRDVRAPAGWLRRRALTWSSGEVTRSCCCSTAPTTRPRLRASFRMRARLREWVS